MIVENPQAESVAEGAASRYQVAIPTSAMTLEGFRAWAHSDDFPQRGRISFIGSEIIVDMSAERYGSHNAAKSEVSHVLYALVKRLDLGQFYGDRILLTNPAVELSHEPDAMFATWATLRSGRLRRKKKLDGVDFLEVEGVPDLVLEILSPSSERTDVRDLLPRYARAGIPECWLIDALRDELRFQILALGADGYAAVSPSRSGWLSSPLFRRKFRLRRERDPVGDWLYHLDVRR